MARDYNVIYEAPNGHFQSPNFNCYRLLLADSRFSTHEDMVAWFYKTRGGFRVRTHKPGTNKRDFIDFIVPTDAIGQRATIALAFKI